MLDNVLFQNIIAVLNAGFLALQIPNVAVQQSYQPTNQGVNTQKTVYVHKLGDHRYGTVKRETKWVTDTDGGDRMVHTESQYYETMFQVDALVTQDPKDTSGLTASDLVNFAAAIMQSDAAIQALFDNGIGIIRVEDVRNPYFENDKNRFQASPSFDFTLEHEQVIVSAGPVATKITINIDRV